MMFQGDQPSRPKGKRTSGFQSQNQGFSLGWEVNNQMNDFQMKKQQKGQNMATKVTSQMQSMPTSQEMTFEQKCRQLIMQNPDITSEQLHQRMALWESNLNKPRKAPEAQYKASDVRYEPVKPVETAKNVIYGGENVNTQSGKSRSSRRNEGTFSLGDGYNYFKDQGHK